MRLLRLSPVVLATAALVACAGGTETSNDDRWRGTTATVGDTTVITTRSGSLAGRHQLDSVSVLWQDDRLERPTQLLLVGTDGGAVATLGREGEGPGEFVQVGAIGASDSDIVGIDRRNRHWARFGRDGRLLASGIVQSSAELPALQPGRVAVRGDTLTAAWGSLIRSDGSPGFGGAVRSIAGAGPEEVARVFGQPYVFGASGTASLASLFGPTPRVAVAEDGRVALTDGVEYCIWVLDTRTRRFCRDWTRVPVTDAVRNPDYEAVAAEAGVDPAVMEPLKEVMALVQVGDLRYAIAGINFDHDGRLWVQAVDSLSADVHPILVRFTPHRRPAHRHWDVFDADGRLLWELFLPTRFTPFDAHDDTIYGLDELDSGELVVATMRLPEG